MVPRILVVDDEPDVQNLIKRRFRQKIRDGAYDFDFALDGEDALEKIEQQEEFDVVLCDINMPRMDGLTLLDHLKARSKHQKTIMVSAYGDMENIRVAMNRGAFDFVTKPIDFDDLLKTIEKSLEELRVQRDLVERTEVAETANRYLESELQIGREIQQGFLPSKIPELRRWATQVHFQSAREVAGDFYDIFEIGYSDRIAVVVADVCDKGVGAALFMTLFRSLLRFSANSHEFAGCPKGNTGDVEHNPVSLLRSAVEATNNYVAETHGHTSMFASVFFGLLDPETGHLFYVNAGHEPAMIIGDGEILQELEVTGPVVGLFGGSQYSVGEATIEPGQALLAYSDGVTDLLNGHREQFGLGKLKDLARSAAHKTLVATISEALDTHAGGTPQFDDITLVVCERKDSDIVECEAQPKTS